VSQSATQSTTTAVARISFNGLIISCKLQRGPLSVIGLSPLGLLVPRVRSMIGSATVLPAGCSEIEKDNYTPFLPYGSSGVFAGASIVFFSFIGFDTVATAAEETIRPERDLPIGIIGSLGVCTVLYVAMCAVITGMVRSFVRGVTLSF
jgi:amino acid transporter